jgi:hypothetical protein
MGRHAVSKTSGGRLDDHPEFSQGLGDVPGALEILRDDEAFAGAEGLGVAIGIGDGDRAADDRAKLVDAIALVKFLAWGAFPDTGCDVASCIGEKGVWMVSCGSLTRKLPGSIMVEGSMPVFGSPSGRTRMILSSIGSSLGRFGARSLMGLTVQCIEVPDQVRDAG